MKYLKLLCVLCMTFCGPQLAVLAAVADVAIKAPCVLAKQNADKWHRMLSKASLGEYQEYLTKRYRSAQQEYLQCLHRGEQDTPSTN
jgi:coproporphyrinogen III oxidase